MLHVRNTCKDEEGFTAQLLKFTTRQNCLDFNVDGINVALRPRCVNTSFVLIVFVANIVRPFVVKYSKNRLEELKNNDDVIQWDTSKNVIKMFWKCNVQNRPLFLEERENETRTWYGYSDVCISAATGSKLFIPIFVFRSFGHEWNATRPWKKMIYIGIAFGTKTRARWRSLHLWRWQIFTRNPINV